MSAHFDAINDPRKKGRCNYSQKDVLMSAFSCMYFQEPSLLQFQKQMENQRGNNNCRTLFGTPEITDTP